MMNSRFYCLQALARLNAATAPQMQIVCAAKLKRSSIFRYLSILIDEGFATRVAHPKKPCFVYKATSKAFAAVYGQESNKVIELRDYDLTHSLLCADAVINLGHYKNVTGFATEAELTKEDLEGFCYLRRPDAIIQITKGKFSYELALEVESSLKTLDRVSDILNTYERTFADKLLCRGLILIATRPGIYKYYQDAIAKRSKEFDSKVFLTEDISLKNLNLDVYGARMNSVGFRLDLVRTQSNELVKYIPLESNSYESRKPIRGHILGSQSASKISGGFNVKDEDV